MLAVKGIYQNGRVTLNEALPMKSSEVIVIFPDNEMKKDRKELSLEKKEELFEEFSGSVERMINEKEERLGALREKYESAD